MQEEVTQRTVALCVETTRLSAGLLQQAMRKVLREMQRGAAGHRTKLHRGKQTLRQLMRQNTGVSNIEITDRNIRVFSATAKKYGIDFALKKDTSGEIPRYLVFFKGRDADVITAAFREFSAKNLAREKKPSIRKELERAKQQVRARHRQQVRVKTRDRGVEL
ncbi:MAG TPA: PcfB family protein [Candidatus Pygmaiobacter gallistercoris]|nr:PcfB family protein [Candidatus Pygmaiobacter gallistercoris]